MRGPIHQGGKMKDNRQECRDWRKRLWEPRRCLLAEEGACAMGERQSILKARRVVEEGEETRSAAKGRLLVGV